MTRFGWTQPACLRCWTKRYPHGGQPTTLGEEHRQPEVCVFCGGSTRDGIYVRTDPNDRVASPYPTMTR